LIAAALSAQMQPFTIRSGSPTTQERQSDC